MNGQDCITNRKEYILKTNADGSTVTVRNLQEELLTIIDEIHRRCVKHQIEYGLIAGSALEICNYHGFIPWDDDMDSCVLKKDIKVLCRNNRRV